MKTAKTGLVALLVIYSVCAHGQTPSAKQKQSIFAPANVSVDGKPDEWGELKTFNRATEVFYTVANNDDNLYFAIRAKEQNVVSKIINGGITLKIRPISKDKQTPAAEITYPNIDYPKNYEIIPLLRGEKTNTNAAAINTHLPTVARFIKIAGMKTITEPEIAIYNELGIKTVWHVDSTLTMTYEVQLPLKYIRDQVDESGTFEYQLIVNGVITPPGTIIVGGHSSNGNDSGGGAPAFDMFSPTDFKANYTLAKKP